MRRKYLFAFFCTAVIGSFLHFAYAACSLPVVGMFAPVSESVWEHLKLLYWPVLLAGFYLSFGKENQMCAWSGILFSMLWMPAAMLGIFYLLHSGFAVQSLTADIVLYYAVLAFGFFSAYRIERAQTLTFLTGIFVILVGLLGAALIVFTLMPPSLPIFWA